MPYRIECALDCANGRGADQPRSRLNDGKCDRRSLFLWGGMDDMQSSRSAVSTVWPRTFG